MVTCLAHVDSVHWRVGRVGSCDAKHLGEERVQTSHIKELTHRSL